ncbi:glycosyltransferase family protein [Anaerocolumna jejuensis]|uniref:glycosyltransferase family protein n=1 Tax=Anaerocolumna jejuensis TaxID=259063 RepID=UPI003F7BA275
MNILVGISGFGHGHSLRQKVIIDELIKRGHTIVISAYKSSYTFFSENYPEFKIVYVHVPFIPCDKNGINWDLTEEKIDEKDYFRLFVNTCQEIHKAVENIDLVISDYEPICAWYAYSIGAPLFTIEQQSKFLSFETEDVGNFGYQEEASRLRFFFPAAQFRLAASFFELKKKENTYDVKLVGPIICDDVLKLKRECDCSKAKLVLVYFSPFISLNDYLSLVNIILSIHDTKIVVFSKEYINLLPNSVEQYRFNRALFLKYMELSSCVISTAGHQLISELILIEKPMLLYPISTFEQQYNAMIVKKHGLGEIANNMDSENINNFLSNLEFYHNNIVLYKNQTNYINRVNDIVWFLEERMGL